MMIQSFLEVLQKRHSAKRFNTEKSLSDDQRTQLQEAIRLSPSSYGLQPYKIGLVRTDEIKKNLYPHSFNQLQIVECDTLFVFCAYTKFPENYIQKYIDLMASERSQTREELSSFEKNMLNVFKSLSPEAFFSWSKCQAYIALGVLVSACSTLGVDICPMEGFNTVEYNQILGLDEKELSASVIAAVGYHSALDPIKNFKKVRQKKEDLFFTC